MCHQYIRVWSVSCRGDLSRQWAQSTSISLGETTEGFEIELDYSVDEIQTDAGGDIVVGGIYRGGNAFVNCTLMEFGLASVRKLTHPYSDTAGKVGVIGCDIRTQAFYMTLTSLVNPPMTNQARVYTFGFYDTSAETVRGGVTVDHNVPLRWALSSRLRVLPVRFRCFPFGSPSEADPAYWYTETW